MDPAPRRPRRFSKRRLALFRWITAFAGLLLGFLTAEVGLRVFQVMPPLLPEAETAIVLHYTDPNGLIKLTPGWKGYVAYTWTEISSQGFRDRVFEPQPPAETLRLAILGDSYMMGDGLPLEKTCAKRLEALLSRERKVEVMNCGVSATNSENQLQVLHEVLRDFRPHMVALSYNLNDFQIYPATRFQRLEKLGFSYTMKPDGRVSVVQELTPLRRAKQWIQNSSYFLRWLASVKDTFLKQDHAAAEHDPITRVQAWKDAGALNALSRPLKR